MWKGWWTVTEICRDCELPIDSDDPDARVCLDYGEHPTCISCRQPITGCIWGGGKCLDCHERGLLPYDPNADDARDDYWYEMEDRVPGMEWVS
jgi:hypothetical protein